MGSWSLVGGWLLWTVTGFGVLSLAVLLAVRRPRFWTRTAPIAVASVTVVVVAVAVLVDVVWQPFPDRIPLSNLVWGGVALLGIALAGVRLHRLRWRWRFGVVVAAGAVLVMSVAQINAFWGVFPTVHSVHDALRAPRQGIPPGAGPGGPVATARPGGTLLETWQPPAGMPASGAISQVQIPATVSRFRARPGYVYLPPAYSVSPRPLLPVLVLLAGQPGSPGDWFSFLRLTEAADAYAHTHKGLGPVIVVADDLGSTWANPLCVDSPLGNAETYLATDVPTWIRANLQVATHRVAWFVGGYSHGGTCALQMAVRASQTYGGFIDISGQREPTLGSRSRTLQRAFGGSAAAFARVNPLDILKRNRYAQTAGFLTVGTADQTYLPQQREVRRACVAAGMDITWLELPGGHNATVWRDSLVGALPWLGTHARLA